MKLWFLLCCIALSVGCESTPSDGGLETEGVDDAVQNATGAAESAVSDKEIDVKVAGSRSGNVEQKSANVRNDEKTTSTTSGHLQTLGFAGIGNAADAVKADPVLSSITAELQVLMQDPVTHAERIDALRLQMVEQTERLMAGMAATTPSFDGLKTIVAIFTMDNATGHTKEPLSDVAAQAKAEAFKTALMELGKVAQGKEE